MAGEELIARKERVVQQIIRVRTQLEEEVQVLTILCESVMTHEEELKRQSAAFPSSSLITTILERQLSTALDQSEEFIQELCKRKLDTKLPKLPRSAATTAPGRIQSVGIVDQAEIQPTAPQVIHGIPGGIGRRPKPSTKEAPSRRPNRSDYTLNHWSIPFFQALSDLIEKDPSYEDVLSQAYSRPGEPWRQRNSLGSQSLGSLVDAPEQPNAGRTILQKSATALLGLCTGDADDVNPSSNVAKLVAELKPNWDLAASKLTTWDLLPSQN